MLLFSDLHLHEDSADTVLNHVLPGIAQMAVNLDEQVIACLGDFWHVRYKLSVRLLNQVRAEFERWNQRGLSVRLLPGNHDQVDVQGQNALEILDVLPNVRVFTEPTSTFEGLWIPYRESAEFERIVKESTAEVLFVHQGIRGAWMNVGGQDEKGAPLDLFADRLVFSGHYHRHQQVGANVLYIGSPYQTKADESGEAKGVVQWTPGTKVQVHETSWGKRYYRLRVDDPQQPLNLQNVRPGDDVRVVTAPNVSPEAIGKHLASLGVSHSVTPETAATKVRFQGVGQTLDGYGQAYVQEMGGELDSKRLMDVFREIANAC